jgi:cytochrome P450
MFHPNIEAAIAFCIGAFITAFLAKRVISFRNRRSIAIQHKCQELTSFQEPVSFWASAAHGTMGALFTSFRHLRLRGDALDDVIFPRFLKYGYTHRVQDWGFDRLWTADPENIQVLLKENFAHYNKGSWLRNGFSPVVTGGLVSSDGEQWKKSRKRVAPHFTGSHIADVSTLEPHMQAIFNEFAPDDASGWTKELDIWKICSSFSMGSTVDFVFGSSPGSPSYLADNLRNDSGKLSIMDSLSTCLLGGLMRFRAGPLYWLVNPNGFKAACLATKTFASGYVKQAIHRRDNDILQFHEKQKQLVFVDAMANCIDDPVEIRNEAITLLFGGQESTGGLMAFTLILLSRHEEVFSKLRTDILAQFGENGPITARGILKLPYLRWVLNETLRLYTIFPVLTRQANQDTVLPTGGGLDSKSPILIPVSNSRN